MDRAVITNLVPQQNSGTSKIRLEMAVRDDLEVVSGSTFLIKKDGNYLVSISVAITQGEGAFGTLFVAKNPASESELVPGEMAAWAGAYWESEMAIIMGAAQQVRLQVGDVLKVLFSGTGPDWTVNAAPIFYLVDCSDWPVIPDDPINNTDLKQWAAQFNGPPAYYTFAA